MGVGFHEKENLHYKILTNIEIDLDYVEDIWIKIKTTIGSVVVVTVYRHPINTIKTYERSSEKLLDIFNDLNSNNRTFYPLRDHNIDQRWSPRGRPWLPGHNLKSLASKVNFLASKPTSPRKCPVLGSRTALFFDRLKRKITKHKTT